MWIRGDVVSEECPRPYITGQSVAWLEMFSVVRRLGWGDVQAMPVREAEAMSLLKRWMDEEEANERFEH